MPPDSARQPPPPVRKIALPEIRNHRCRKVAPDQNRRASPARRPPAGAAREPPVQRRFPSFRRKQRMKLSPAVHFVSIQTLEKAPRSATAHEDPARRNGVKAGPAGGAPRRRLTP